MANLWMLDLSKLQDLEKTEDLQDKKCMWHQIDTSGKEVPGKISRHSSIVYGDKMFMFGGSKESSQNDK